jgi:DNA-binding GntR family transcriptional regulator
MPIEAKSAEAEVRPGEGNSASTSPKYQATYEALRARLDAGRYPVGGRLPAEEELARAFDVSRVTIRRSLDMLVSEGYLQRRQGSGYTVITLSPPSSTCLNSFTDAMLRAGREPTSRMISIRECPPGAAETAHLSPELSGRALTRLERLRLVDNVPQMFVRTFAPSSLIPGVTAADFPEHGPGQSILRILAGRFGLKWSAACEDISPRAAEGDIAEHLNVAHGTPILLQACTAFDDLDRIVFFEEVFRLGTVSFDLTAKSRRQRLT